MINIFKSLAEARRRKKQIRAALSQNDARFKAALEQIEREYRARTDRIMNAFIHELTNAGGLDCPEEEAITAKAERRTEQARALADQKIRELESANERRIKQIYACYH